MEIIYIIIMLAVVGGIGIIREINKAEKKQGKKYYEKPERKYYQARDRFFTRSEYLFFKELEKQNNGKYLIFSKVRLEDIVQVIPTLDYKTKRAKRNSIKSRHIDFVLVDKESGKVVKAIELDGASHNRSKQSQSDKKKDVICKQAGIDLVRVRVGDNFEESIRKVLLSNEIK